MLVKGDPNQAPPVVGVTDQNINRPYAAVSPALRSIGQVQSTGTLDYHGLLFKFQRRFANNFSVLNSYTWNKAIDLNSDNDGGVTLTNVYDPQYNRGPSDYDVTHTLSSSWIYELPFGRGQRVRRLADERHPLPALGPAADDHADAGRAVDRHAATVRTGIGDGARRRSDDRPAGSTRRRSRRRPTSPAPTATPAATSCADRGSSTSTSRSSSRRRSAGSTPSSASRRSTC